jgi:predicted transcriptional regulator
MANVQLGPTAQKVLALLQENRGIAYTADDLCEMVDCGTTQAQTALEILANAGMVERQQSAAGRPTYVAR